MIWKTIGLFYATSNCVHHFIAIGEFKLELQSGNPQFGSKSPIFYTVWPWNLTDDLKKFYATSSFVHHFALTSVALTLDLWHWPFAWTSRFSMVMTYTWKFHDDTIEKNIVKKVWQTDGWKGAAWLQLKSKQMQWVSIRSSWLLIDGYTGI